jgi:4'-phosphopantetheinyl transferase
MQNIWIVKISENYTVSTKQKLLEKLPDLFSERAKRYLDEESALSFLTGRLLLKKAIFLNGLPTSLLEEIHYSEYGKPGLLDHNFSISHSNGYVVLVFGTKFSIGIDIEKKKNIDLNLFNYLFTDLEWNSINEAENSLEKFYWFWVRKEALLKAVGCSLKDLKKLEVLENYGMYKDKRYHFEAFDFNSDFNGVIAMEEKVAFNVEFVDLMDLLKE